MVSWRGMIRTGALLFLLGSTSCAAQTFHTVQNGIWNDPLTWDCGCIPSINSVVIGHEITITTNMILFMDTVHVTNAGWLLMDAPHSVAMTETVINDATMELIGDIDVDGALIDNGIIHIDGDFHCDNLLHMGGPGTLFTCTNMANDGLVNGVGRICVAEATVNAGTIEGEVDFCDATPTTSVPPIIDLNTGTVGPSVTFCLTGACTAGMAELAGPHLAPGPNPAHERTRIDGAPAGATVRLRDMNGRTVLRTNLPPDRTIGLAGIVPGVHVVSAQWPGGAAHGLLLIE